MVASLLVFAYQNNPNSSVQCAGLPGGIPDYKLRLSGSMFLNKSLCLCHSLIVFYGVIVGIIEGTEFFSDWLSGNSLCNGLGRTQPLLGFIRAKVGITLCAIAEEDHLVVGKCIAPLDQCLLLCLALGPVLDSFTGFCRKVCSGLTLAGSGSRDD